MRPPGCRCLPVGFGGGHPWLAGGFTPAAHLAVEADTDVVLPLVAVPALLLVRLGRAHRGRLLPASQAACQPVDDAGYHARAGCWRGRRERSPQGLIEECEFELLSLSPCSWGDWGCGGDRPLCAEIEMEHSVARVLCLRRAGGPGRTRETLPALPVASVDRALLSYGQGGASGSMGDTLGEGWEVYEEDEEQGEEADTAQQLASIERQLRQVCPGACRHSRLQPPAARRAPILAALSTLTRRQRTWSC